MAAQAVLKQPPVRPAGRCFGRTVPVQPPVEHGCSSTARTAVFDRLMSAVPIPPTTPMTSPCPVCWLYKGGSRAAEPFGQAVSLTARPGLLYISPYPPSSNHVSSQHPSNGNDERTAVNLPLPCNPANARPLKHRCTQSLPSSPVYAGPPASALASPVCDTPPMLDRSSTIAPSPYHPARFMRALQRQLLPAPLSGARTAVFDRWSDMHCLTEARANWSDRFVQPVPAGPVRLVPGTDRTGLSDPPAVRHCHTISPAQVNALGEFSVQSIIKHMALYNAHFDQEAIALSVLIHALQDAFHAVIANK
ncbi:hypothetical protein PCASD_24319 [Puccinia coronata f. sp. avenae]|uniref:Uncharacterized protein n=1 Tax=Puccinia coronata f. sp. avenae TaxID=200324 RepID=A0A2N5SDX4_9BASI|nr:hypothetical protein PCASD_24319 [Puccinia coronata f. sp. avenae]